MNAYDRSYERIKAVQKSAELLRDLGTAFFPLDVIGALSAFGKQINLVQYADLKKSAETKASDSDIPEVTPQMMSKDGFCTRVPNFLFDTGISGSVWYIYYDDSIRESRIRFTLMHELGHIVLRHHQLLHADTLIGLDDNPEYSVADKQADLFSINILAPAPAVFRLLTEHGFSYVPDKSDWQLTNPDAPFLRNLGSTPNPEVLIMTAFGLSQTAANRRLRELPTELELWHQLDPALYAFAESIPHRAGWFCWVCHTRRRTASRYCPGCGHGFHYEFQDPGAFSRPVMGLRTNGQFEFCSVCGNSDFSEDALYCPICGSPVVNECENASYTDGDFIRSGMEIIRGTHRCRPTDIYCGSCGVLTKFGARHGPKENYWLPTRASDRCRTLGTHYPDEIPSENGKLTKCPACGSTKTMRNGRYCAECMQPLENVCASDGRGSHACGFNDRYCSICGKPSIYKQSGWLTEYTETKVFTDLQEADKRHHKWKPTRLMIQQNGEIFVSENAGIGGEAE